MNDAHFLNPKFHLTALGVFHGLFDIGSDCAKLGVRHQALGTKHFTQAANNTHHIRGRNHAVVIEIAGLHIFHQILSADLVSARSGRLVRIITLGKDGDFHLFTRA